MRSKLAWIAAVLIIGVVLISPVISFAGYYIYWGGLPNKQVDWGTIGDFVGGTSTPILTALSVIGLLYTIFQNQRTLRQNAVALKQNAIELQLTRKELKDATKVASEQAQEAAESNRISIKLAQAQSMTDALLRLTDLVNSRWSAESTCLKALTVKEGSPSDIYISLKAASAFRDFQLEHEGVLDAVKGLIEAVSLHAEILRRLDVKARRYNAMSSPAAALIREPVEFLFRENIQKNLSESETLLIESWRPIYGRYWS
ncbi:hypothetical protein [Motiliproteus sp.]|uniref:hypothetical protein n=1 Tax=Motiliproteus sp. TaxID=1898955 RepID=UPI003BA913EA